MNRLESGEPREVIIYKIILDGKYRHMDAYVSLSNYVNSEADEAIVHFYDTMNSNVDALEDAYNEALLCSDIDMKKVSRLLDAYIQIGWDIIEDGDTCKITDEELIRLMGKADDFLELAEKHALKCLTRLGLPIEDELLYLVKRFPHSELQIDDEK